MYISVMAPCKSSKLHLFVCPTVHFLAVTIVAFKGYRYFLIDGESVDKNSSYRVWIFDVTYRI